uniref:Fanconi anemia complementation group B n=1 Tax=Cynoglossus semilaevis TaxID=244447 RepID=A0A3P8VKH8_CYNSE
NENEQRLKHLIASGTNEGELEFCCFLFKKESSRLLKAAHGAAVICKKTSSCHLDIVKCKCAADFRKRVSSACVLVTRRSVKGENFKYSLFTLSSPDYRPRLCFEFKLPYEIKGDVSILQGPTVLWRHAENVFYKSLQAGEVRQIPAKMSHSVVTPNKTMAYIVQNGQEFEFDGAQMLPHPYISITQCILVLSAEKVDNILKSTVVAATSYQQLVLFLNGTVKDVCALPFEKAEEIQLVNTGRNGCLFVVSFHQGHVCALWKETFQIASQWSGVSSVHVDDFLGCGTDQMLIFKNNKEGHPLESFLITDLCGISYSSGQDTESPQRSSLPPDSNHLALQALESRLQSGLTVLHGLQREVKVKDRVLQQSVEALAEGKAAISPPEQEDLVALWDSGDESKVEHLEEKMEDMPVVSNLPHIDKLWHRIMEDHVVVGVMLMTDSSTGQSSTPAVIQTTSQVLLLPTPGPSTSTSSSSSSSSSVSLEPAAKRKKPHDACTANDLSTCRMAVTAVARLAPLLNSDCVKCRVMLHYVQRPEAFSFITASTPVVLQCGEVTVGIHNHFQSQLLQNPSLTTEEIEEDLLCLLTLLDRWVFHINSPDQSLGDIDGWIQKKAGCRRVDVSPQYLLFNSSVQSSVMLLHWRQINPFNGELQVQMLKFLDCLMSHLPMSCTVHPVRSTGGHGAAQIFPQTLELEVGSLRDSLSSLFAQKEENLNSGSNEAPESSSVEGLQRCREKWQQDVERSRRRLSPLVDLGRYRQLTQRLCKVQLNGDLAALLETQGALLH